MDNLFNENKKLQDEEFKNHKLTLQSYPTNLEILISDQCNLSCFMCRFGVYKNKYSTKINPEIYKRLKSLYPYLEILKLTGAEIFHTPTNKEQLTDSIMLDSLQFDNMKLAGATNGILINQERAEIIAKKFQRLELALDTSDEKTYSSIRIGGELENFINNISIISKIKKMNGLNYNYYPQINFSAIVMERTYKNIPELVNLVAKLGGYSLGLRPLSCDLKEPEWNKIKNENIFINKEKTIEWKQILKQAKQIAISKNIELIDTTIFQIADSYPDLIDDDEYSDEPENNELCSSPWDSFYVGSNGYSCFGLCSRLLIGDLNKSSIQDIWNGKPAKQERTRFLKGDFYNCSQNCVKNYSYAGTHVSQDDLFTKLKKKFNFI